MQFKYEIVFFVFNLSFNSKFRNFRIDLVRVFQALANQVQTGQIIPKKCDVTNEAEVLSIFQWVKENFGHLDVFVNNAGVIKSDFMLGKIMFN